MYLSAVNPRKYLPGFTKPVAKKLCGFCRIGISSQAILSLDFTRLLFFHKHLRSSLKLCNEEESSALLVLPSVGFCS